MADQMVVLPKKFILLGSGELGKEFTIAAKRLGCVVIACDRYVNAPAMQVADKFEVLNMNDPIQLKKIIDIHKPDFVVPEIEAIAVTALKDLEKQGINIIPTAKATETTMNRDLIRDLASKVLGIKTARFAYASTPEEIYSIGNTLGWPILIKPIMSSSGKGQSLIRNAQEIDSAWEKAIKEARGASTRVIIEEYIKFDLEITLLTIKQKNRKTLFCEPIGHEQEGGDYQCSWQPATVNQNQLEEAKNMATKITNELGGAGIFGVEFFIRGNEVIFSELSPRPHDTGLVTLISQNMNEFELHLRAILGIPIPKIKTAKASASRVILSKGVLTSMQYAGVDKALEEEGTSVYLFGKPNAKKNRRMGVVLAASESITEARKKADKGAGCIKLINRN